jgi:hypothetical protein
VLRIRLREAFPSGHWGSVPATLAQHSRRDLSANQAFGSGPWPVIAVTCLAFESRIAAGPGIAVLHGHTPNLRSALETSIALGCNGVISFGIAGGLAPDLAVGAWVVATGVIAAHKRYPTDRDWSRRLLRALGGAVHADIAGVDAPVVQPHEKRLLHHSTSSVAVDMESHVAAEAAAAHHALPSAALIDAVPIGPVSDPNSLITGMECTPMVRHEIRNRLHMAAALF